MNTENQKCVGVVFSNRAIQDIKTETYDKDPVETGGLLLGYVLESGHWVVVEIIPPGDNSTHRYAYLEYDESLAQRVVNQIADKYEQKLELLGLWHRHPGSMDFFSGTDDGTNITFAELNPSYGAISGLVNIDPKFRMTMYHVDSPLNYTKVETFVGDDIIPAELLKLKEGVTFEDIDAIKKPKTRSEQQPAPQQTRQTPQQTTSSREESRRTTPNREHHEKPQVIIQSPDTVTGIFKKFVLEHTKAFCGLVAVFFIVIGIVFLLTSENAEYKKHIQPLYVEYQEFLENTESPEINDLSMYIDKFNALKLKLKDQANKDKIEEIVKEITGKKTEIEKSAEADKITKLYTKYQDEKSLTSKMLEDYIRRFNILKLNLTYEENKTKIDDIIEKEIQVKHNEVKKEEQRQANIQAAKEANAKTAEETQKEYDRKIKPWYENKYMKELNNNTIKLETVQQCLSQLTPLNVSGKLKYSNNIKALSSIIEILNAKKREFEEQAREQKREQEELQRKIQIEHRDFVADKFTECDRAMTTGELELCINTLQNIELQHQENKTKVTNKINEMKSKKKQAEKKEADENLLNEELNKNAIAYFNKNFKDRKKDDDKKYLEVLNELVAKLNNMKPIQDLIKKNDPEKLKPTLQTVTTDTACDKHCDAYKTYKITADEKDEVRKKFEETCQGKCGIQESKK